jgi:hypothetical protein
MWLPFPMWLIGAIVFLVQMSSAPPNFYKKLSAVMMFLSCLWAVIFIVVATSVGITGGRNVTGIDITLAVMLPIQGLLMAGFVAAADMAFRAAFGPLTWDLSNMRELRGMHLGFNLAGVFVFPIFTYIGVPLTLAKVARHHRAHKHLFGWSAAFGVLTLLLVTITILLSVISAGTAPINYGNPSRCRKRAVLQETSTLMSDTTATANTMMPMTTSSFQDNSTLPWDTTTTNSIWTITSTFSSFTTDDPCWAFSSNAWSSSSMFGQASWNPRNYQYYYSNMLQQPDTIIAVVSLSMFAGLFHIIFIILADRIILKNIEPRNQVQVVASQVPRDAQQLVHPCASCGTSLQFVRTGPTTQVQCYQCNAIVEFTTV